MNSALSLIQKQIARGAFPHASLFSGADNDAKEEAILAICTKFSQLHSPDIFEIGTSPSVSSGQAAKISIADVRALVARAATRPLVSEKNIFIIRGIERLHREAEVALLKTLEDTSLHNIFIATTESYYHVLPTIRSRFSHIRFGGISAIDSSSTDEDLPRYIRSLLLSARARLRKSLNQENVRHVERLLAAQEILGDPTLNPRMLRDYLLMLQKSVQ